MTQRWRTTLWGGALVGVIGILLMALPLGDGLTRMSYDLPFAFRSTVAVPDLVIIYLDELSRQELAQEEGGAWDRRFHTELLKRLTADEARLVFFDILFVRDGDPEVDGALAEAMRDHGRVVLGGDYRTERHQTGNGTVTFKREWIQPNDTLREAAAGWGLLMLQPIDHQFGARKIFKGLPDKEGAPKSEAAVWVAATLEGAAVVKDEKERHRERWLNFYGPAHSLDEISLATVLSGEGMPPGFFKGKAVFVGGHPSTAQGARDLFATPHTRIGRGHATGVEMLATSYANLVRQDWLTRIPWGWQWLGVLAWGFFTMAILIWLRPGYALVTGGVLALGMAGLAVYLQVYHRVWGTWLVPVMVQTPLAVLGSVMWQYVTARKQKKALRLAFASYLSPHLADRIAGSDVSLELGGITVEATILFSDLEGFTRMSEGLSPDEVSTLLTTYFNQTTRHILNDDGTIIKYIGDAVMAVWGAPLPDERQADRAVRAARGMIASGRNAVSGRALRTRIGIHSGPALAGNLGSDFRFDYTVIGATTNLASRLEALNKPLKTEILISDITHGKLTDPVLARSLGRFQLRGMDRPVGVYEVLVLDGDAAEDRVWMRIFQEGMAAFKEADWAEAVFQFNEVIRLRDGSDGPSEFFLVQIDLLQQMPPAPGTWEGVVKV